MAELCIIALLHMMRCDMLTLSLTMRLVRVRKRKHAVSSQLLTRPIRQQFGARIATDWNVWARFRRSVIGSGAKYEGARFL